MANGTPLSRRACLALVREERVVHLELFRVEA
jgi:hypothetical protein